MDVFYNALLKSSLIPIMAPHQEKINCIEPIFQFSTIVKELFWPIFIIIEDT